MIFKTPLSSAAEENVSFALEKEKWLWTSLPTPGGKNIIKEIEEDKKEEVKKDEKAKSVDDETAAPEPEEETADGDDNGADKNSSSDEDLDFADGVNINEIFPDPAGRDNKENNFEWVELFNENERDVNLKGWCLDDVLGKGSKTFCFSGDRIIAAKGYLIIGSEETKIAFNNSEEEVNLLWPDKMVVDSVSYQKSKEGFSYSLGADGTWTWTQEATPSSPNTKAKSTAKKATAASSKYSLTSVGSGKEEEDRGEVLGDAAVAKEQYAAVSIAEVKALPLGSLVQLFGLVSVPHGVLGKDILYIWEKDSGEGIQIFGTGNDLSSLLLGDEVKIYGRLAEVGGEKRLLAAAVAAEKISGDNLLESFTLDFANLESELGGLAATEGEVGSIIDANTFLLKAAGGEVKIYAEPETGISFADLKSGDRMAVTGIFSRTSLGYRVLPRFKSDVRFLKKEDSDIIVKSDETAAKNNDFAAYLKFALLAVVLVVAVKKSAFYAENRKRA
ncbi:MAG: lamin tail domain-containing protein [Patescibacteria group bacterium]